MYLKFPLPTYPAPFIRISHSPVIQIKTVNITHSHSIWNWHDWWVCGPSSRSWREECDCTSVYFAWLGTCVFSVCMCIWMCVYPATYGSICLIHCCSSQAATTGWTEQRVCVCVFCEGTICVAINRSERTTEDPGQNVLWVSFAQKYIEDVPFCSCWLLDF